MCCSKMMPSCSIHLFLFLLSLWDAGKYICSDDGYCKNPKGEITPPVCEPGNAWMYKIVGISSCFQIINNFSAGPDHCWPTVTLCYRRRGRLFIGWGRRTQLALKSCTYVPLSWNFIASPAMKGWSSILRCLLRYQPAVPQRCWAGNSYSAKPFHSSGQEFSSGYNSVACSDFLLVPLSWWGRTTPV